MISLYVFQFIQSSQITDPCWNPSSSSSFKTDDITARNPNFYCQPVNGQCVTETFQYSTKNDIQACYLILLMCSLFNDVL